MKTVIIFGGAGYIGQNITQHLAKLGYCVIIPYQRYTSESKLRLYGNLGQIIPLKFNELSDKKIQEAITHSEIVINLKTIWQENRTYSYKKNIYNFNVNLINLINEHNRNEKIYVFFSGLGVSEHSMSKRIQFIAKIEKYIEKNVNNFAIVRSSIVIGNNDQFLSKLIGIIKYLPFIPLFGDKYTKIQPVYIRDVVQAVVKIIEKKERNSIFELGGPEIFTYETLYRHISQCMKKKPFIIRIPKFIAKFFVLILEKLGFKIITYEQFLLFYENSLVSNKFNNFNYLSIVPRDLRDIIYKIINK